MYLKNEFIFEARTRLHSGKDKHRDTFFQTWLNGFQGSKLSGHVLLLSQKIMDI